MAGSESGTDRCGGGESLPWILATGARRDCSWFSDSGQEGGGKGEWGEGVDDLNESRASTRGASRAVSRGCVGGRGYGGDVVSESEVCAVCMHACMHACMCSYCMHVRMICIATTCMYACMCRSNVSAHL